MATVTTPTGEQFEETSGRALEYYQREQGYEIGVAVPEDSVELVDGTVEQVLAEVGDDPQLAAAALAAESAKGDRARSTLVERLQAVASAGSDEV